MRVGGLGEQPGAAGVDGEDAVPFGGVEIGEAGGGDDAGVGDDSVEAAERVGGARDQAGGCRRVGEVAGECDCVRPPRAAVGADRLQIRAFPRCAERECDTRRGQPRRDRASEALARSGYERSRHRGHHNVRAISSRMISLEPP